MSKIRINKMKPYLPIILIVLSIGAYFVYIKPAYVEIQALTEEKKSNQEILNKTKDIIIKRDEILKIYDSLSPEELNRLNRIIPSEFDSTLLANHINAVALKYGLIIDGISVDNSNQNVNPEAMMDSSLYKEYKGSFKTKGKYENFISLIKDLELDMSIIDIVSISISGDTKNNKSQSLMYDIGFKTYSLK